ncbi:hypothetical protein IMZ31_21860 (plasmid) [Pontibacillus sp. ALD_SL1]|uniref:hypothetical protein n=1 Tax=Pontibacillus sp. ALD_SL1 TaxID=2777185 RepID=UPI001A975875|nr:hypothetical protein [Pontibacillus sp. ALD_SL1]QST02099.1 hypothetical protein IMZ31_21860 [Pontibacillus sp. ALD_SL1]
MLELKKFVKEINKEISEHDMRAVVEGITHSERGYLVQLSVSTFNRMTVTHLFATYDIHEKSWTVKSPVGELIEPTPFHIMRFLYHNLPHTA